MNIFFNSFFISLFFFSSFANSDEKPIVIAKLNGQMGNNLFQMAAAYSLAKDNNAQASFSSEIVTQINPDWNITLSHLFSRCYEHKQNEIFPIWEEPFSHKYTPILYQPNIVLEGYFQSEKYFKHYRKQIINLFAPIKNDNAYIQKKYGEILNNSNRTTVGIQFRWYNDGGYSNHFIQYGHDYLKKATQLFPGALFIVSTNKILFAKKYMPKNIDVLYLTQEPFYIDFYILSMCQHNIITNSSFGWWSAWLNKNPNKIVVTPNQWFNPCIPEMYDIIPEEWIRIDAKWGNAMFPHTVD